MFIQLIKFYVVWLNASPLGKSAMNNQAKEF